MAVDLDKEPALLDVRVNSGDGTTNSDGGGHVDRLSQISLVGSTNLPENGQCSSVGPP